MLAQDAKLLDGTALAGPDALAALRRHAVEAYPEECIGYIDAAGAYHRLANIAAEPTLSAFADRGEVARLIIDGQLRALCHSHPGGPDCPSQSDMLTQLEMAVPFIIVATNGQATADPFAWGDELCRAPLLGRSFRHGVHDCYSMIQDWYAEAQGIDLPEYPRNWNWWLDPTPGEKDLYQRYFADAGFRRIDAAEVREGDVWLAAFRSEVPNHAGIVLDGGLTLHHASSGQAYDPMRLSARDSMARYSRFVTHWLRRD